MAGTHANTFRGVGPVSEVALNVSSSGNNTVVAAVAGKQIVLLAGDLVCAGAVTITWESGGGSILDGPKAFAANGGQLYPFDENGHFASVSGESLLLNLNGAVQVGGRVKYALV